MGMKVLDISAGKRVMWFDKCDPVATFVDIRAEVGPDFVADSRALPYSIGEGYNLIVFDPPHVNTGKPGKGPQAESFQEYYGHFTTEEIRSIIRGSASEAHRVSAPDALMAFKWNDHDQKLSVVLSLMEPWWRPLFGQRTTTRTKHASGTYWVMLVRMNIEGKHIAAPLSRHEILEFLETVMPNVPAGANHD